SFSWDPYIAEFNLSNPDVSKVDLKFLFNLSDDALPVIDKHKNKLRGYYYPDFRTQIYSLDELEQRKIKFFEKQGRYTWLSWNLEDSKINRYFEEQKE
ncbi:MAG TPA: hypothetical protein VGK25_12080, partial [Ignavibacteria bacterium]